MRKGHSLLVLLIAFFLVIFVPSIQAGPFPTYAWHTFYGSNGSDSGLGIVRDGSGNLYITGESNATWNGPTGQTPLHSHSGNYDIFVLKLDSNGTYLWHTFYGSNGSDSGFGIITDTTGNVYVTGESNATWNGPTGQTPLHSHSGFWDIVVLKLNSSGTYQWHTFYGSNGSDGGLGIVRDGSGNLYITGESNATWNGPAGQTPIDAHSGLNEIFVLKLNTNGAYQWHTFHGSNGSDSGLGIITDTTGNVYVTGESNATWDGPAGQTPIDAHSGLNEIFVLKLNTNGAYQWHTFHGSNGSDSGLGIVTDASGNPFITGKSTATWNGPAGESPLNAHSGLNEIFVLKLNTNGAYQWHTFHGSNGSDSGSGIVTDPSGNLHITGESTATWNGPAGESPLNAHSGLKDIVVLKLAAPVPELLPDLIETAVSNPPADSTAGSSFSVTDTVENQGSASAGTSTTSYYLSLDAIRGSGDTLLTGSRSVPSLGINETNDGVLTVTIPSGTAAGSYFLLACGDNTNLVDESLENNNCIASGSKVGVVSISSVSVTSPNGGETLTAGSTHTVRWTYGGNPGSLVRIQLFKGGALKSTIASTSVGSGGSGSYNWSIPSTQVAGSDYQIKVTSTANAAYTDISDNNFTILGPPPPPTNVSASDGTYVDRVEVTWAASSGATSYTVYRAASLGVLAKKTILGTTSGTSFNDTTAIAGRTYYYWVRASNTYGTSSFSAYNAGKRSDGKPPAPANVSASDGTYLDRVELTWATSSGATSYTVYRAASLSALAKKIVLGTTSGTLFNDTTAVAGRIYYYWVRASNTYGMSSFSAYDAGKR